MESREIIITDAALKHGNLYITSCGKDFFPKDVYGAPNRRGVPGIPITLKVSGLGEILTDIPRDGKTGKPRTIFRERTWVKEYVKKANLKAGDIIKICHLKNRTYQLEAKKRQLTFIDLFAGIGGIRLAFEKAGAKCVFSSEWDKFAQQTYEANFGEKPKGDIRKIKSNEIPDHDILLAGFPCQPFSISGVSKKNALGKPHGFNDPTQGTLFFEIKRILKDKTPSAFMLENVKNLKNHDKGKTYNIILATLDKLGYTVFEKIIDGSVYVPQHRERIYLVGFRDFTLFKFPEYHSKNKPKFRDILDENVPEKYTLTDHLWNYLQNYAKKHKANGNGFGFGMTNLDGVSRTLSARYHKDGSEILIPQGKSKNPRRLTPFECAKLMGFTKLKPDFKIPVSDTQAYRQFGNSVVVPVVYDIAKEIVKTLRRGIE